MTVADLSSFIKLFVKRSSEIRGLCLIKSPSETLQKTQNFTYIWNAKTHVVFLFVFHFMLFHAKRQKYDLTSFLKMLVCTIYLSGDAVDIYIKK